jgi:flagellar biosynthetic protein FliR
MIMGLSQSFDILPIGVVGFKAQGFSGLTMITKEVIEMGLRMSGPIMVSIFVANIAMGVLGRTVPQINVMVTSLPVQILMGVFILILTMPLFFSEMNHFLDTMATEFISILKVL